MNKIYNINNLSNLSLEDFELDFPKSINNNRFFTKIKYLGNELVIQAPKCFTKEGIINNNNHKCFCNLKYNLTNSEDKEMECFLNNITGLCKKLIFSKNNTWFQDSLEEKNLDVMFSNPVKYNNNKSYYFLKLYLEKNFTNYDESENECSINDINNNTSLIPLIKINGIVFNDTNFNLELSSSQFMCFNNNETKCLIKLQIDETNNLEKTLSNDLSNDLENVENNKLNNLEEKETNNLVEIQDISNNLNKTQTNPTETNTSGTNPSGTNASETNKEEENKDEENLELFEYNLDNVSNLEETIKLKKPNDLYYELYDLAKKKAKLAKKDALNAYLELQKIKEQYNLDVSDSDEEFSDEELEKNMENDLDDASSTNSTSSNISEISDFSGFSEDIEKI